MKAILWDMNGVLVDDEPLQKRCWLEVLDQEALAVPEGWWELECLGQKVQPRIASRFPHLDEQQVLELFERKHLLYTKYAKAGLKVVPGALEMARYAYQLGLKQALVTSSGPRGIEEVFKWIEIERYLEVIIDGTQVSKGKPDPQGYILAISSFGLNPEECLAIEDSPMGIKAAKAAGAWCLALTSSFKADKLQEADWTVDGLDPGFLDQFQ